MESFFSRYGSCVELIGFKVAGQNCCVHILSVLEIRGWVRPSHLPHPDPSVRGIINLRGSIVPIVDLAVKMGLDDAKGGDRGVVMVVLIEQGVIGVAVDSVTDIITIESSQIQDARRGGVGGLILGFILIDGEMIRLLDPVNFFPQNAIDGIVDRSEFCV